MVSTFIGLLDIQSWWEIPCISHFCSLFSSAFNLPDIDIEDLESALLTDGTDDTVGLLPELIVSLLKGCDALRKQRNEITTSNYQMFLRRFLRHQCRQYNTENYFDTDIDFQALPLRNKLLILYSLCHFRLDSKNVQDILSNLEADSLRVEPLGYDSKNSGYWYFYGTRLYREDVKAGGKNSVWQVICFTEEDWQNLAAKFQNSSSPKERALYNILAENFLPKLPQLFRERERLRRRKLLQVRNSVRIRSIVEEKQKQLENQQAELLERQKLEEHLKQEAANKAKGRARRRSSQSSTASGISTYASSIRAESTNSSEFLYQREKFCLSPDVEDNQSSTRGENAPDLQPVEDNQLNEDFGEDIGDKTPKSSSEEKNRRQKGRKRKSNSQESSRENILADSLDQEDKENCCFLPSNPSESELSGAESQSSALKLEMAPTNNIKLPGRQTNNSLSTLTGNIFLPTVFGSNTSSTAATESTKPKDKPSSSTSVPNSENPNRKKKTKGSEVFTETDEVLQIGMHKVLLYVKNHRDAWPFMDPVEEDIAPRYYSIIRRPMDLLKMEEKLDNGEYAKFSEFRNDFKLIVNNCRLYNGQNNEYTEMVNNLQEAFDKATKKYFDHISSDEEGNMSYPDSKTNVFREKYFNKTNTNKLAQNDGTKKGKEKDKDKEKHEKFETKNEKSKVEEVMEGSRANKRKRKDKDKRRKKKSKTKTSTRSEEEDNEEEDSNEDEPIASPQKHDTASDEESSAEDLKKTKRKFSVGKKMPEHRKKREASPEVQSSSSSSKKSKKKFENSKGEDSEENKKSKSTSSKKSEDKSGNNKKQSKTNKTSKGSSKKNPVHSDNEGDVSSLEEEEVARTELRSEKEFSSDNTMIDYPIQEKSKKKHSSSLQSKTANTSSDHPKSTNSTSTKYKEKENQTAKSKAKKSTSSISVSATEEVEKTRIFHKDNRRDSSSSKKKRNKSLKKCEESQGSEEDLFKDQMRSRSPSPLYKVDLHKKYAKSASVDIEVELDDNKNKFPLINSSNSKRSSKKNDSDDLMSISSRSLSPCPSPVPPAPSEVEGVSSEKRSNSTAAKKKSNSRSSKNPNKSPPSKPTNQETEMKLSPFMDKYDLIKQRRNRNTDEKWKQIVKEAEKIKDNKKTVLSKPVAPVPSKEKNQKLRETIEKLKAKNAKSKERSVLIDEIFGVKPTQEIRDEKMIFEKLRETCLDSKTPATAASKKVVEIELKKKQDEYTFVDCLPSAAPLKGNKKKEGTEPKKQRSSSPKKASSKKNTSASNSKKPSSSNSKTNMEALELETEQTLKDINRWLEHTPRFPEFSSASNSPSRYNLLDDFDAVASKLDPNDFRRSVPITPKIDSVPKLADTIEEIVESKPDVIPDLIPSVPISAIVNDSTSITSLVNTATTVQQKSKDSNTPNTTQLLPHPPPPPPHIKSQIQKETKRKTLKDKLTNRRKDLLRTIDRLQPGKAKGNLISNIHNANKPDEIFPLGAAAKIKEVKNSLVVKTDETAPKLSLGSVLNTEGFGLGQLHNFSDAARSDLKIGDSMSSNTETYQEKKTENSPVHEAVDKIEETIKKEEPEKEEVKVEKSSATPNLSAWFKAFGAPKKAKKTEEEEKKVEIIEASQSTTQEKLSTCSEQANNKNPFNTLKSPPTSENFSLPAPRQRKASTGSTISERSSFSQDPDSPRVGIDDRFGAYSGPYASPIGASPIMVSPKPEEITKPTSPYPLNGAIKVGFYQDTTTKSSPEKSCSPRELPSPYPQYSQHIYSSAPSPNVNNDINNTFSGCYTAANEANKSTIYTSASPSPLYEQYKQPQSQESDYNSSMSPSTNPNSPYQQPQNSPYQQHQTSPYQQAQNSPYQQPQTSPFQGQSGTTPNMLQTQSPNPQQPNIQQQPQSQPQKQPQPTPQQQACESPRGPNSPYQQPITSPYQQPLSPYNQSNPASPYQQQQPPPQPQPPQQANLGFPQQQSTTSPTMDSSQQVAAVERPFSQENPQYPLHERNPQYQQQNQPPISYEQEIQKSPSNMMNKLQPQPEWNNQMDVPNQPPQSTPNNLSNMNPLPSAHIPNQLNTPPLQPVQTEEMTSVHHLQQESSKDNMPYQRGYQQYAAPGKELPKPQNIFNNDLSLEMLQQQQRQLASQEQLVKVNPVNAPKNSAPAESELLNLGYPDQQKLQKPEDKPFDSTLNKHQQMFDSFLGSMAAGKNLGFGKPLDISTSKAFEMFNRAATMGFSKEFPNALMGGNKPDVLTTTIANNNVSQPSQIPQQQHHQGYHNSGGKMMENPPNTTNVSSKPLPMVNNNYNQPQQMQMSQADNNNKLQTYHNIDTGKIHQQQSTIFAQKLSQQHQSNSYHPNLVQSPDKINNELVIPNPRQDQMSEIGRNQHINMDLPNYKPTFNNPTAMLDPLRNLNHPLAMVDESMLGLQNSTPTGYYEKNIPPAHMLSKNLGQVYQSPSPYVAREPQNPASAYVPPVSNVPTAQPLDGIDPKVSKRTKKKKSSTPTPVELVNSQNQNAMLSGQQQLPPLQGQAHPSNQGQQSSQNPQQGFQLYAGLKTAVPATTDASAISLKSATSMVPGSAFNFGPSPTGLGIPTGIYGDNSGYLEEFRGAPNPYYIPPGHRATPDTKPDAAGNGGASAPASYHQFLTHTSSRSSYPFMNSPQLDPNSPIYQQYLQQEELRTRMILNQGLLGPGAAAGYHPQPGYRPALGMPKPYNRQPWF